MLDIYGLVCIELFMIFHNVSVEKFKDWLKNPLHVTAVKD